MWKLTFVLSVFLFTSGMVWCSTPERRSPCDCRENIYDPVCGEDGETYANDCSRGCEGIPKLRDGACPVCAIPKIRAPVCGENGRTYVNRYLAECLGISVVSTGECPVCPIPAIYAPVCGVNGRTYSNKYEAKCIGVEIASVGAC